MQPRNLGKYEILDVLGSGGMATVYLARVVGPGGFERLVALKTINEQWGRDPSSIAMFLDEARLAASVRHPNVVQVHEVVVEEGRYFIAMDYVAGINLASVLSKSRQANVTLPLGLTIHVVAEIANGLQAAHETKDGAGRLLGMIHRDVAPKNILVGFDGVARILDFGVAKARDRLNVTAVKMPKGTLAYMAPEQLDAKPLDRRVDVFALSIVLWEMLTCRRLFPADVWSDRGAAQAPSTMAEVPPVLDAIAMRGLKADPSQRFQTTRELAQALLDAERELQLRWSTFDSEEYLRKFVDHAAIPNSLAWMDEPSTDGGRSNPQVVVSSDDSRDEATLVDSSPALNAMVPVLSISNIDGEPIVVPVFEAQTRQDEPRPELSRVPINMALDESSTPKEDPPDLAITHVGGAVAKTVPLQRRPSNISRTTVGKVALPVTDRPMLDRPGLILLVLGGVAAAAFLLGLVLFGH